MLVELKILTLHLFPLFSASTGVIAVQKDLFMAELIVTAQQKHNVWQGYNALSESRSLSVPGEDTKPVPF